MNRIKITVFATFLLPALGWAALSLAAETGGTSLPTCTRDIWTCGDWSACDRYNEQSRRCVLTFECKDAETPMPPTKQQCPAKAAPAPTPTPAPAPTPEPEAAQPETVKTLPSASTPAPKAPAGCTHDTWICLDWACGKDGVQRRDCRVTLECEAIQTPPPQSERKCPSLQCGNLPTMLERISCRQKLEPAGIARENEIEYLPELCRARSDKNAREECADLYRKLEPCWELSVGAERNTCAGDALGLIPSVGVRKTICDEKTEIDRPACMEILRKDVYNMVLFRMYDLEERAEALADRDVPTDLIARFSVTVEEKKIAFDAAKDSESRRQAVLDLQAAWKSFVEQATLYLQ